MWVKGCRDGGTTVSTLSEIGLAASHVSGCRGWHLYTTTATCIGIAGFAYMSAHAQTGEARVKAEVLTDAGSKALQTAPGVVASTSIALGAVNPQWFVVIPTAVFVLLQIAHFCWKWKREWKAKRGNQD